MRLISCDIYGFGCLSDTRFDFDEGLNCFCLDNGYGKSTLAAFIRVMFYGMPKTRGNDFNDRSHYVPDAGGRYGGALSLEWHGATYRIERLFGAKSTKDDSCSIFDEMGNMLPLPQDGVGEYFWGLDEEAFCRTIFVGDISSDVQNTSSINRRLHNIENDLSPKKYQNALKVLTEARKAIRPQRTSQINPGTLVMLGNELINLRQQLDTKRNIQDSIADKYLQLNELRLKGKNLSDVIRAQHEIERQEALWQDYDHRCADIASRKAERESILCRYPQGLPSDEDLGTLVAEDNALKDIEHEIQALPFDIETVRTGSAIPIALSVAGIVLLAVAVLFLTQQNFVITIISVMAASAAFVLSANQSSQARKALQYRISLNQCCKNISDITGRLGLEAEYETGAVTSTIIRDDIRDCRRIESEIAEAENDAHAFRLRHELTDRPAPSTGSGEIARMEAQRGELIRQIHNLEASIASAEEECVDINDVREEITRKERDIANESHKLDIISRVQGFIEEAEEDRRRTFINPVKESYVRIVSQVAPMLGSQVAMNYDYTISLRDGGIDSRRLSAGQSACMKLCLRLAIIEHFGNDNKETETDSSQADKPFIILDDPFVGLDSRHLANATTLLKKLSENQQMIYFCCHESRAIDQSTT